MPRYSVELTLRACVVLLMFGTSSIADDEVVFNLNDGALQQVAAQPTPVVTEGVAACPNCPPGELGDGSGLPGWRPEVPHYDLPSRSYSLFRSPASYGWAYEERCAPTPWRPRGNGIPKRSSCYRMDYRPYELTHDYSKHGPAFYTRYELYPCEECHAHAHHLQRFYGPRR